MRYGALAAGILCAVPAGLLTVYLLQRAIMIRHFEVLHWTALALAAMLTLGTVVGIGYGLRNDDES